jgi:hypothetical protein
MSKIEESLSEESPTSFMDKVESSKSTRNKEMKETKEKTKKAIKEDT